MKNNDLPHTTHHDSGYFPGMSRAHICVLAGIIMTLIIFAGVVVWFMLK